MTQAAGVQYLEDRKEWVASSFNPDKSYVVAPPEVGSSWDGRASYVVKEIGSDRLAFLCGQEVDDQSTLTCTAPFASFKLQKNTLRFQATYDFGYLSRTEATDTTGDTPSVSIGVCSPF